MVAGQLALGPSPVLGQNLPLDPAQLDYQRPKSLVACPEEWYFRAYVAGRFGGVDPFTPDAPRRITLTLNHKKGGAFVTALDMHDRAGAYLGGQDPPLVGPDCQKLVDRAGDIVASWLVPLGRPPPAPPAPSCHEQPPTDHVTPPPCPESPYAIWPPEWPMPPLEKPQPDPPKPLDNWPIAIRVSAATWTELIASGWGLIGFSGGIGARYHAISLDAEVHGDPPLGAVTYAQVGAVSVSRLSGALLLCVHFGWFSGCGVGDAGRLFFPHHVHALPASDFYATAGVRTKLDFPIAPPRIFLSVGVDLRTPLRPQIHTVAGANIFDSSGAAVGLGLGLLVELPR